MALRSIFWAFYDTRDFKECKSGLNLKCKKQKVEKQGDVFFCYRLYKSRAIAILRGLRRHSFLSTSVLWLLLKVVSGLYKLFHRCLNLDRKPIALEFLTPAWACLFLFSQLLLFLEPISAQWSGYY